MNALYIKNKRKELGLTQEELAKKIGVSVKTVSNYENGEAIPETKMAILLDVLEAENQNTTQEPNEPYLTKIKYLENEIKLLQKITLLQEENITLLRSQKETDSE